MQCSVKGLIDYSKFEEGDILELVKEKLILESHELSICKDLLNLKHITSSILQASKLFKPEDSFDRFKSNIELYKQITNLYAPWINLAKSNDLDASDPKSLQDRWEAIFGKLDSPEVKAKLDALKKQSENTTKTRLQLN